jgi:hypothetical protein
MITWTSTFPFCEVRCVLASYLVVLANGAYPIEIMMSPHLVDSDGNPLSQLCLMLWLSLTSSVFKALSSWTKFWCQHMPPPNFGIKWFIPKLPFMIVACVALHTSVLIIMLVSFGPPAYPFHQSLSIKYESKIMILWPIGSSSTCAS